MHCRAVTVQIQPGRSQEAIDIYNNSLVPAAKQQKGFRGAYLMTDAATGKALSISVWETENDMVEGERSGYYQEQIAKFGALFAGEPVMERYELSVAVDGEG
jgi:heme-degrading monooxygenase HmoA